MKDETTTKRGNMRVTLKNTETLETEHVTWGLIDRMGRRVGARSELGTVEVVELPEGQNGSSWPVEFFEGTGERHHATVQATRDGKQYGSGQATSYHKTREEAAAWIEKRLASSYKRAAKQFQASQDGAAV